MSYSCRSGIQRNLSPRTACLPPKWTDHRPAMTLSHRSTARLRLLLAICLHIQQHHQHVVLAWSSAMTSRTISLHPRSRPHHRYDHNRRSLLRQEPQTTKTAMKGAGRTPSFDDLGYFDEDFEQFTQGMVDSSSSPQLEEDRVSRTISVDGTKQARILSRRVDIANNFSI